MNNQELLAELKKSGISTSNTGGLLNTEQSSRFITSIITQSAFLNTIRVERGIGTMRELDIMSVGARLLYSPAEDSTPDDTLLRNIATSKRFLKPVEVMLPYNISLRYLEENIERSNVEETINNLFAKQFANDLQDLAFNGNTKAASNIPDYNFIKITDSFFAHFLDDDDVRIVARNSSQDWKNVLFPQMYKELPNQFKVNANELVFLVSFEDDALYRAQLAERETQLGDAFIIENTKPTFKGISVEAVPYIPEGSAIFTKKSNLAIGFGREISVYKMLNPRARRIEYTISAKVDFDFVSNDLIVACL